MEGALEYITEQIEKKEFERRLRNTYKPIGEEEEDDYLDCPDSPNELSFEDIKTILGRKWRHIIINDIYYIAIKYKNYCDGQEIDIPTTSTDLVSKLGSPMAVWRTIEKCRSIGLISLYRRSYSVGNYSKSYLLNEHVRDLLIDFYIKEKIIPQTATTLTNQILTSSGASLTWMIPDDIRKRIKISSNLRLPLIDEGVIRKILYDKYEIIRELVYSDDYENTNFLYFCTQLLRKSIPSITLTKQNKDNPNMPRKIYKIGLRDTSPVSNLRANFINSDEKEKYGGTTRQDYLNGLFPNGWWEYDVPSSIWTLTRAINTGILGFSDMYSIIHGGPFKSKRERDLFKQLSMPLYFDSSSIGEMWHHLNRKYKLEPTIGLADFTKEIEPCIHNIDNKIGPTYDSMIFVVESYVYAKLAVKMLDSGWHLVQVYDCFYSEKRDGWTEEMYVKYIQDSIQEIVHKLITTDKRLLDELFYT